MFWIVLAVLLLLWILKFGLAISGWLLVVLMAGIWLLFFGSLFVRHEHR